MNGEHIYNIIGSTNRIPPSQNVPGVCSQYVTTHIDLHRFHPQVDQNESKRWVSFHRQNHTKPTRKFVS